ncbi:MAG: hypothetical protein J0H14_00780 [Alphaproteobacteria bacterium]|nr:hypothetical protein [Alphaproteobacteria bacterium]
MKWLAANKSPTPVVAHGADALRLIRAKISLGWRPLLGLWLGIMCVAGIVQWLGPPSGPPLRDVAKPVPPQAARPKEAKPLIGTADLPAQGQPGPKDQMAAPNEAQSSGSTPTVDIAAAPATSAEWTQAPPNPPEPAAKPAGDPPPAATPKASERQDIRPQAKPLLILHASRPQAAEAAAAQLAPQVGLTPAQVDTQASADLPPRAVIRFYAAADHPLARRIGQELSQMGYSWRIENLSDRASSKGQVPEVWLPDR